MRIGIVTEWFDRGSAFVSLEFKSQLEAQGYEISIYARNEAHELNQSIWPGNEVHIGKHGKVMKAKSIDKMDFEDWIKTRKITHIIFNEQIWIPPVLWARKLGVITIGYVDYYTKKSINSFKMYDGLICNTKRHYSVFNAHHNSWFIPWGTNIEKFKPAMLKNHEELVFLHSAGWSPDRKGTDLCIRSFLTLNNPKAKLVVHSQIDLMPWLESKSLEVEVLSSEQIQIIQQHMDSANLMSMGDVYVYPSRLEGIGLTQAEALASGLPIIVPDEPPMNEFAVDKVSRRTPISHRWARADGYFWDMVEVSKENLALDMEWFCSRISEKTTWSKTVRESAEINFNSKVNFANLGHLIEETQQHRIGKIRRIISEYRYGANSFQVNYVTPIYLQLRKHTASLIKKILR